MMYHKQISNKERKLQEYKDSQPTTIINYDDTQESSDNLAIFVDVLPFNFQTKDPLLLSPFELLIGGYANELHPSDGFLDFHHLKYVTTNAKQLSLWFQMTMGFKEIAYRGLETGSMILASHVIRNGNITIELVSTLESVTTNPTIIPLNKEDSIKSSRYLEKSNLIDIFNDVVSGLVNENLLKQQAKDHFLNKINHSRNMEKFRKEFIDMVSDINSYSVNSAYDLMDSFLIANYLTFHGEGVMDVAFSVEDVDLIFNNAINAGGIIVKGPRIIKDEFGTIKTATIGIPDTDIRHTLIENINYNGNYFPCYTECIPNPSIGETSSNLLMFDKIDHCVENYSWNQMDKQTRLYAEMFGFHKFWSVDDTIINTGKSSLNSTVMCSSNGKIKIPINEPSDSKFKGQIEEFNGFNGGPGVQHIAMKTFDIIATVKSMKEKGIRFNELTTNYYKNLEKRLTDDDIELLEDFSTLKELNILVDYDSATRNPKTKRCNYLLQIFTNPLTDRPTLFLEIIQRHNHNGFGKGTFKGLYESIELDQKKRGTLVEKN